MTEYEELRGKLNLAYCKNSTCYARCAFPERDCPQAKVATREILSIIAEKCWLKDEGRELPDGFNYEVSEPGIHGIERHTYHIQFEPRAKERIKELGWRPVKPLKEEWDG